MQSARLWLPPLLHRGGPWRRDAPSRRSQTFATLRWGRAHRSLLRAVQSYHSIRGSPILRRDRGGFTPIGRHPNALVELALFVTFGVDTPLSAVIFQESFPAMNGPPSFSWSAVLSISVPLFLVTMASQNIAGVAVVQSFGYTAKPGPWIATTGVFSFLSAPFGGHAVNLAAITAALCAGDDAHDDPGKRYWASVFMGWVIIFDSRLARDRVCFVISAHFRRCRGPALIGAFVQPLQQKTPTS